MKREKDNEQGVDSSASIVRKTRARLEEKGIVSPDLSKMKPVRVDSKTIIFKKK